MTFVQRCSGIKSKSLEKSTEDCQEDTSNVLRMKRRNTMIMGKALRKPKFQVPFDIYQATLLLQKYI